MSPAARSLPGYEGLVGLYQQQEQQHQARFERNEEPRTSGIEMGHRAKVMVDSEIPPAFFGDWMPDAESGKKDFGRDVT